MNKISWNRAALAGFIVLLPISLMIYYEGNLRETLNLPSAVSALTEPLVKLEKKVVEQAEEKVKALVTSPEKIASSPGFEANFPENTPNNTEKGATKKETPRHDKSLGKVPGNAAYNEKSLPPPKQRELHAGKTQDGILVPDLILDVGEAEVRYLLLNGYAFLVVTVNSQSYLLTVSDQDNPYKNVSMGYLKNQQGLSERYLPLARSQLKDTNIDILDNQVIKRIGHLVEPEYSLVFSAQYNQHLRDIQMAKVAQLQLDLTQLRSRQVSVTMYGELLRNEDIMEMSISDVKVGDSDFWRK